MCQPMVTHMRQLHGQSGHESTDCTQSVVHCVGGWKTWPIDMCSNKDVGRSERETPTACECEQAHARLPSKRCFSKRTKERSMWKSHVGSFSNDSLSCGRLCHDSFWFVFCFMIVEACFFANAFTRLQHVSLDVHTRCDRLLTAMDTLRASVRL